MKALIYRIELLAPALLGHVEGDPNSSVSYNYLPGSVLRGSLLERFARQRGVASGDPLQNPSTRAEAQRLFFGAARFLNAYPVDRLDNRALLTPRSWLRKKKDMRAKDEQHVPILDAALQPPDKEQYLRVGAPFCWFDPTADSSDSVVRLIAPRQRVTVHTQCASQQPNARNYGRPRPDDGALYRYQSLDAGQTFRGIILCDDADAEAFRPLLDGEYWLGKAHTAGYGRARFKFLRADPHWREAPGEIAARDGRLIVTLTSPLLLRDAASGQFVVSAAALGERIAAALGVKATLQGAFVGAEVVGGFNRKWGLPLPQAPVFSAGSVLVLELQGQVPVDQLRALEQAGLGERRLDGFGRLVFNWQQSEQLTLERADQQTQRGQPPMEITDPLGRQIAERMARRRFEQKLEALLLARAAQIQIKSTLSRAQLNRLRSIALNALRDGQDPSRRLQDFIGSALKRQTTRERWQRARIIVYANESKPLLEWIEALSKNLTAPVDKWHTLVGIRQAADLPSAQIGRDIRVSFGAEHQRAFSLRLLAEVLRRAAKQSKQAEGN